MIAAQPSVHRPERATRPGRWNRFPVQTHSLVFPNWTSTLEVILNHRGHDLADVALQLAIVGDGRAHGYVGGSDGRNTECDQLCGINQQASGDAFFQSMAAQVADLLADEHQVARGA